MREFTVSGVVGQAVEAIGQRAGTLVILAIALIGLPKLLSTLLAAGLGPSPVLGLLPLGFQILGSALLEIMVIRIIVSGSQGQKPPVGATFSLAVRSYFPVLAISFLSFLGVSLASLLLVVPGLMVTCRWIAVIPAEVVERTGVMESFRRSAALTSGLRWRILGCLLVFALAAIIVGALVGIAALLMVKTGHSVWGPAILDAVFTSIFSLAAHVGVASVYLELRRASEGLLGSAAAEAFD